nr:hypothetical protein [uncultured Dyadobacter sp.]
MCPPQARFDVAGKHSQASDTYGKKTKKGHSEHIDPTGCKRLSVYPSSYIDTAQKKEVAKNGMAAVYQRLTNK